MTAKLGLAVVLLLIVIGFMMMAQFMFLSLFGDLFASIFQVGCGALIGWLIHGRLNRTGK